MTDELAGHYGYKPDEIEIEIIGTKPGEKMYEELMNEEETRRVKELRDYFAVIPAFTSLYRNIEYTYPGTVRETIENPYHSGNETPLAKPELKQFLIENNLLHD